uniref:HutD-family protein n=1 Tax=OCS116 cluster bacterium TaxID=2030921 RepID=A0A2A4Z201_9PROT
MHKNHRFNLDTLKAETWKNGKGVTRQIANSMPNEAYWRFSIADVSVDGDFSVFPELARILTVVAGKGMLLSMSDKDVAANYAKPIHFAGNIPVYGKLLDGAVQNFNLIYDANKIEALVRVGGVENSRLPHDENTIMTMAYCLATHQGIINPTQEIRSNNSQSSFVLSFQLKFKR